MDLLARELSHAEESARVLDLQGRALVDPVLAEIWEAVAEDAAERAAIMAEASATGGAVGGGLVLLPTSATPCGSGRVAAASKALRVRLKAGGVDRQRVRLARMRRSVGFAARSHEVGGERPGFRADYCAMLTLTYRGGAEQWEPRHLSKCLDAIRHWMTRRDLSMRYVWVAELQKRGSVHYHVALWLPAGLTIPKADRRGWWPHGASRIEAANSAPRYLMKYLSKGTDLAGLPDGARMHGCGGLEVSARRAKRWLSMPAAVRSRADIFDPWRPARGGGWINESTGELLSAEFARVWLGDRWGPIKVRDHGRPFLADGPFMWLSRGALC